MSVDEIFDIVDDSLRRSGDTIAIQLTDRVFICEIDELPECGVPDEERFEFNGSEILESDIGGTEGNYYLADCQPTKHFVAEHCRVIEEQLVGD